MKNILLFLLLFSSATSVFAQQKEWQHVLNLLKKEAQHFKGKDGYIQLGKSTYNRFFIQDLTVNDTSIAFGFWLRDRFKNQDSEQLVEETIVWMSEPFIQSANIFYDYHFYFINFPEAQFLKIELHDDIPLMHHVVTTQRNLKSGKQNRKELEGHTNIILIPIRAKNRAKIMNAIDAYQQQSLKTRLDEDRLH